VTHSRRKAPAAPAVAFGGMGWANATTAQTNARRDAKNFMLRTPTKVPKPTRSDKVEDLGKTVSLFGTKV